MIIKKILLVLPILFLTTLIKAQTRPDTTRLRRTANPGVSTNQRSERIRLVLMDSQHQIEQMRMDNTLSQKEKSIRFKQLIAIRRARIDSLLTPAERAEKQKHMAQVMPNSAGPHLTPAQQHEAEMNQVPHKRVFQSGVKDTSKVN